MFKMYTSVFILLCICDRIDYQFQLEPVLVGYVIMEEHALRHLTPIIQLCSQVVVIVTPDGRENIVIRKSVRWLYKVLFFQKPF